VVAVNNGRLGFGTWEHIFCGVFDGWRGRRVLVKSRRPAVLPEGTFPMSDRTIGTTAKRGTVFLRNHR
jgi:hypothetical protein